MDAFIEEDEEIDFQQLKQIHAKLMHEHHVLSSSIDVGKFYSIYNQFRIAQYQIFHIFEMIYSSIEEGKEELNYKRLFRDYSQENPSNNNNFEINEFIKASYTYYQQNLDAFARAIFHCIEKKKGDFTAYTYHLIPQFLDFFTNNEKVRFFDIIGQLFQRTTREAAAIFQIPFLISPFMDFLALIFKEVHYTISNSVDQKDYNNYALVFYESWKRKISQCPKYIQSFLCNVKNPDIVLLQSFIRPMTLCPALYGLIPCNKVLKSDESNMLMTAFSSICEDEQKSIIECMYNSIQNAENLQTVYSASQRHISDYDPHINAKFYFSHEDLFCLQSMVEYTNENETNIKAIIPEIQMNSKDVYSYEINFKNDNIFHYTPEFDNVECLLRYILTRVNVLVSKKSLIDTLKESIKASRLYDDHLIHLSIKNFKGIIKASKMKFSDIMALVEEEYEKRKEFIENRLQNTSKFSEFIKLFERDVKHKYRQCANGIKSFKYLFIDKWMIEKLLIANFASSSVQSFKHFVNEVKNSYINYWENTECLPQHDLEIIYDLLTLKVMDIQSYIEENPDILRFDEKMNMNDSSCEIDFSSASEIFHEFCIASIYTDKIENLKKTVNALSLISETDQKDFGADDLMPIAVVFLKNSKETNVASNIHYTHFLSEIRNDVLKVNSNEESYTIVFFKAALSQCLTE